MTAARRFVAASAIATFLVTAAVRWSNVFPPAKPESVATDRGMPAGATGDDQRRDRPWITGRVIDADGPVAGVRVRLQAAANFAMSDAEGKFRLHAEGENHTITAAKPGYYVAVRQHSGMPLEIELQRPAEYDSAEYAWIDPAPDKASSQNCGNCHAAIFDEWQSSAHAAGLANRHFLNLYEGTDWRGTSQRSWSLLGEHPDGSAVCASCHAPAADSNDPNFDDLRSIDGLAARGVQCDFCHKVADVAVDRVGWQHGRFAMTLLRPGDSRPQNGPGRQMFFGPLDDASRGDDVYSPLQSESRYCAACHEGVVFGVPVYSTYSEWLASPARAQGKQCQSCHMAPDGEMHNIAPGAGGIDRASETLASHALVPGGKAAMLRRALHLATEIVPDQEMPQSRVLEITLRADQVGHHVPTGFIDRHLILYVEAIRRARQTVGKHDRWAATRRGGGRAGASRSAGPAAGETADRHRRPEPGTLLARWSHRDRYAALAGPREHEPLCGAGRRQDCRRAIDISSLLGIGSPRKKLAQRRHHRAGKSSFAFVGSFRAPANPKRKRATYEPSAGEASGESRLEPKFWLLVTSRSEAKPNTPSPSLALRVSKDCVTAHAAIRPRRSIRPGALTSRGGDRSHRPSRAPAPGS